MHIIDDCHAAHIGHAQGLCEVLEGLMAFAHPPPPLAAEDLEGPCDSWRVGKGMWRA